MYHGRKENSHSGFVIALKISTRVSRPSSRPWSEFDSRYEVSMIETNYKDDRFRHVPPPSRYLINKTRSGNKQTSFFYNEINQRNIKVVFFFLSLVIWERDNYAEERYFAAQAPIINRDRTKPRARYASGDEAHAECSLHSIWNGYRVGAFAFC